LGLVNSNDFRFLVCSGIELSRIMPIICIEIGYIIPLFISGFKTIRAGIGISLLSGFICCPSFHLSIITLNLHSTLVQDSWQCEEQIIQEDDSAPHQMVISGFILGLRTSRTSAFQTGSAE